MLLDYVKIIGVDDSIINKIIQSLKVYKNRIVFDDRIQAEEFARYYMIFNRDHWMGKEEMFRYHLLALILKEALHKNYIEKKIFVQQTQKLSLNYIIQTIRVLSHN